MRVLSLISTVVAMGTSTSAIATCPTPLAIHSLALFPAESVWVSYAESVFRVTNATTGDYGIVLRYGQRALGTLGTQFDATHQLV